MRQSREEMQLEAFGRATSGQSLSNFPAIIRGFMAKGIPEDQILPRENVLTYHAWKAVGRQVRRGEHGVKVCTFVAVAGKDGETDGGEPDAQAEAGQSKRRRGYRRPWTATVFHVSQTDPIGPEQPRRYSEATPDPVDLAYEDACARACGL